MGIIRNKVLVVDDFHTHRLLIAEYLEDAGYDVKTFDAPEDVLDELRECEIVVMDVQFGNDRPFAGIDYLIEQIQSGVINPFQTTIVFKTLWSKEVIVQEDLERIQKYEWWDCSQGLEFTDLRTILRRRTKS